MNENKNVLRLTPEDSKLFIDACIDDSPPNDKIKHAAANYYVEILTGTLKVEGSEWIT